VVPSLLKNLSSPKRELVEKLPSSKYPQWVPPSLLKTPPSLKRPSPPNKKKDLFKPLPPFKKNFTYDEIKLSRKNASSEQ